MSGPSPAAGTDPIVARLDAIGRDFPDLAEAARVYAIVLPLLRDAAVRAPAPPLTAEQAREKLSRGEPLLGGLAPEIDADGVRELLARLAHALAAPGNEAQRLGRALDEGRLDVAALLPHVAAGERAPVDTAARGLSLDPALLWTLAQGALRPALWSWRAQLAPLAAGVPWERSSCFVCGARASLAELRGTARARHLRCTRCGADWRVNRLRCPHCGTEDHAVQRLLTAAGRPRLERVEACDGCGGYVKAFDAFDATPPELLAAEDLATLHLDAAARGSGCTG